MAGRLLQLIKEKVKRLKYKVLFAAGGYSCDYVVRSQEAAPAEGNDLLYGFKL